MFFYGENEKKEEILFTINDYDRFTWRIIWQAGCKNLQDLKLCMHARFEVVKWKVNKSLILELLVYSSTDMYE